MTDTLPEVEVDPAAGVEADEPTKGFPCGECDEVFETPLRRGLHRRQKHGIVGSSDRSRRERETRAKKRGGETDGDAPLGGEEREPAPALQRAPRRARNEGDQSRRKRMVKETLMEFLDFSDELRGRSDSPDQDLADVLRRDADKIASSLAWAAERFNPLGLFIDRLAGHGGVITFVRGFLGIGRHTVRRWRQALAERETFAETGEWPEPGEPLPMFGRYGAQLAPEPEPVDVGGEG